MLLSIIMPVYNEINNIEHIINAIKSVDISKEIIVVDDFSKDGTRDILKKINGITLVLHDRNSGKGAAIRSGLNRVTGDYVLIKDADLEYSPHEYNKLLKPAKSMNAQVVYGSRMLGKGVFMKRSYYANRFLTFLFNILYNDRITDMETCYKLIRSDIMRGLNLISSRFEIEPEITCKLSKRKIRIIEVPISYQGRRQGKKIGPGDGIQAVWNLLKWKFKR